MKTVKLSLLVLAVLGSPASFAITVESLPASEYADTEVSTNVPFEVRFDAMSRMNFSISLEASPSNSVEVSIGADANADDNLSPEEAAYTFGFDCGRWFNRCAADDSETFQNVAPDQISNGRVERDFLLKRSRISESWDTVKIIRRGKCGICELVSVEGSKPGAALILR